MKKILLLATTFITVTTIISKPTYASFYDDEKSENNQINTTTLDAEFTQIYGDIPTPGGDTGGDPSVGDKIYICHKSGSNWKTMLINADAFAQHEAHGDYPGTCNIVPGEAEERDYLVENVARLPFAYSFSYNFDSENSLLCENTNLILYKNIISPENQIYNGNLTAFTNMPQQLIPAPVEPDSSFDVYFAFFAPPSGDYSPGSCNFTFNLKAWQEELTFPNGFTDEEAVSQTIVPAVEGSGGLSPVVLNEILPNPEGLDTQLGLDGEWVEIYNNSDSTVDLTGWYITDKAGATIAISAANTMNGDYVLDPKGSNGEWVVVFMNNDILNNSGSETVSLYNQSNQLIDHYSYSNSRNDDDSVEDQTPGEENEHTGVTGDEGKSHARIPDGVGEWIDPVPTPGTPNVLEEPFVELEATGEEVPVPVSEPIQEEVTIEEEQPIVEEALPTEPEIVPQTEVVEPVTPEPAILNDEEQQASESAQPAI